MTASAYEAVSARGYAVLGPADVLDGVAALVPRIEVEALFGDGSRLIVLHDPIGRSEPPPALPAEPPLAWLEGALGPFAARNAAEVPIGLTSHVHLFELNRRLELDRGAVYGLRPALEAGAKVVIEPGTTVDLFGVPIAGLRVVRGHGGPGRRSARRAGRARACAGAGARAGLSRCLIRASASATPGSRSRPSATTPTGIATGMGGTLRDGLAVRAERGGVGLAITDVLLLDPVLGRAAHQHRRDGRPHHRGRPRRQPRHDGRDRRRARRLDRGDRRAGLRRHAGRRSTATCTGSRRRSATRRSPAA